jgi:pimeloyl-ACP methyl ester carboxylesterase
MSEQTVIDGVDVFIEGQGKETIVMIHGWPDTYRLWDAQVAFLAQKYRCVRFTLPGFDIEKLRRAYTLAETIGIVKNLIERVSPGQKVILMLHDWGCAFGYQFAMQHPSMVSGIIGVDIGDAGSREHVQSLSFKSKAMIFGYQSWLALAWRIGGRTGDNMTKFMARKLRSRSDQRYIGSCMNYPYYITWTGAYGSYKASVRFKPTCPMLYIYGRRKPFMFHSPKWVDQLGRQQGNRVLGFDASHWVMVDKPQEFNEAVEEWLASPLVVP